MKLSSVWFIQLFDRFKTVFRCSDFLENEKKNNKKNKKMN